MQWGDLKQRYERNMGQKAIMRFYSNVCAVDSSDYMRKTGSCFKLRIIIGLFNCIVWEFDIHGWDADNLASSLWNAPVGTPVCTSNVGTSNAWLLAVALQRRPHLCAQFQEDCPQNGWWASCHHVPANPLYLWTHTLFQLHHLQCLPIPLKQPLFLMVMHCTTLRMLLYPLV